MAKYDIFISYRRVGGAQFARILQLMLQQRGYKVFLDYDELTDGKFGDHIKDAIKDAPIFMLVLSKDALVRCKNEGDWVRQEIQLAISLGKQIIPVNPDNQFEGYPDEIPEDIKDVVGTHQHSDVSFGQTLGITVEYLIDKRVVPYLGKRNNSREIDQNFDAASETLKRIDARNKFIKRMTVLGVVIVIAIVFAACYMFWQHYQEKEQLAELKAAIENNADYKQYGQLQFSPDATMEQMQAVDRILSQMSTVTPDSLWMSQFECSVADYHAIIGGEYDKSESNIPMTNISHGECLMVFVDSLRNLTHLNFDLPSADEWEYAAKGGYKPDNTTYSGSNDVNKVAWYKDNSNGKLHPSDGQQGKEPNGIDLFDMSGNVAEMCNSPFVSPNGEVLWSVCGGNINTPAQGVTVTSRTGMDADSKNSTTGFRLIIRKE